MKRQPEIIVDENGTTWALLGTHNGKAYYGNVEKLQADPLADMPPIKLDMPPHPTPDHFAYLPIWTPARPTTATGA